MNPRDNHKRGRRSERLKRTASAIAFVVLACLLAGAALMPAGYLLGNGRLDRSAEAQTREANLDKASTLAPASLSAPLQALISGGPWLNTSPLRAEDLKGKVVLVNFWTYSCINSLRTLPYLRAWAQKYKDRGLVVVGVHTPEFAFEHDPVKVKAAVGDLPVGYPVVLDNDYETWNAFSNNAWPGFYFVDASGRVRHRVLGEGQYDQSERWIQELLSEAGGTRIADPIVDIAGAGVEAAPDWEDIRTPETYVGFARGANFSSPGGVKRSVSKTYGLPSQLPLNHLALSGSWTVGGEHGALDGASGKIALRFHARDLHLVLGRESSSPIRFRVTIDGKPPGADHGVDADAAGWGSLDQDRMYQLIRQGGPVIDRTFEIEFQSPGVRAYSFTFG